MADASNSGTEGSSASSAGNASGASGASGGTGASSASSSGTEGGEGGNASANGNRAGNGASSANANEDAVYRRKFEKAERELNELKRKQMSDEERREQDRKDAVARAEAAETKLTEHRLQSEFELAAVQAGAKNPRSAFKLVDRSLLTVDSDGNVQGVKQAMEALKKSDSYLFGEERKAVGSGGGNTQEQGSGAARDGGRSPANNWLRRLAGR